jgi:hypothetical protein
LIDKNINAFYLKKIIFWNFRNNNYQKFDI